MTIFSGRMGKLGIYLIFREMKRSLLKMMCTKHLPKKWQHMAKNKCGYNAKELLSHRNLVHILLRPWLAPLLYPHSTWRSSTSNSCKNSNGYLLTFRLQHRLGLLVHSFLASNLMNCLTDKMSFLFMTHVNHTQLISVDSRKDKCGLLTAKNVNHHLNCSMKLVMQT